MHPTDIIITYKELKKYISVPFPPVEYLSCFFAIFSKELEKAIVIIRTNSGMNIPIKFFVIVIPPYVDLYL